MNRKLAVSFRHFAAFILCAAVLAIAPRCVLAQGSTQATTILRTGSGGPLITGTQTFFLPESQVPQEIEIAVGFATDELPGSGTFFDSLTLTVQDDLAAFAAIFMTIDTTGTLWAPTPGGVFIDPNSIVRQTILFPDITGAVPANRVAYMLKLPIPAVMTGRALTLYLDLFDNANSDASLGWMSDVVVVPEPTIAALLGLGAVLFFRRKSSKA
jgi:hypothetical protein